MESFESNVDFTFKLTSCAEWECLNKGNGIHCWLTVELTSGANKVDSVELTSSAECEASNKRKSLLN